RYPPPPALHSFPTRRSSDLLPACDGSVGEHTGPFTPWDLGTPLYCDQTTNVSKLEKGACIDSETANPPPENAGDDGVGAYSGFADRKSTRLNSSHLGISYAV